MEKLFSQKMTSTREAAELFSISTGTLQNWRSLGLGPRFSRVRRKVLYRVEDLEKFFTSHPVQFQDLSHRIKGGISP